MRRVVESGNVRRTKTEDLTGRRFGRLTVVKYEGNNDGGMSLWLCRCDCGREKVVQRCALINGTTWRCGRNCPFDTGMVPGRSFGALMLVRKVNESTTQTDERWLCRCECGNEVETTTRKLRRGVVTSCGCHVERTRRVRDARGCLNDTAMVALTDTPKANNTTGVRGVSKYADGRYHVTISFRRRVYHLGAFTRLENAASVRRECERLIWGPAVESNGEVYPSHAECIEIVSRVRKMYQDAMLKHVAEAY